MTSTTDTLCAALRSQLMAPPMEPASLLSLYPGDATTTAAVVLGPDGSLRFATRYYLSHSERQRVEAIEAIRRTILHFPIHTIVIPAGPTGDPLADFLASFKLPADLQTVRTASAGPCARVSAGDDPRDPAGLSPATRIAISLGRAAQDPFQELSQVAPSHLIDATALDDEQKAALQATLEACRAELDSSDSDPRGQTTQFRFSETIHDLSDVTPGMQLPGIVTNVTAFGAFVNIGIPQEGLVHISEMTGEFVKTPADVVKPGQAVDVRVLSINPETKRLALSLRPKDAPKPSRKPKRPARRPERNTKPRRPSFEGNSLGDAFGQLGL